MQETMRRVVHNQTNRQTDRQTDRGENIISIHLRWTEVAICNKGKQNPIQKHSFAELDLVDRMPDELWSEVEDIAKEEDKNITSQKQAEKKKAKWLSQEAINISDVKSQMKTKGTPREDMKGLNAKFQRQARKDEDKDKYNKR